MPVYYWVTLRLESCPWSSLVVQDRRRRIIKLARMIHGRVKEETIAASRFTEPGSTTNTIG